MQRGPGLTDFQPGISLCNPFPRRARLSSDAAYPGLQVHPSLRSASAHIWKTRGVLGFYQGYKATVVRDVPYTMMELGLYDLVKSKCHNEVLSAALVGGFVGYVTNPLDIVKTRLMTSDVGSITRVVRDIWTKEGPQQFMCGALARASWLMPFTTMYLPAYDVTTRWLLDRQRASTSSAER